MVNKKFLFLFLVIFLGLVSLNFVSAAAINVTICGPLNVSNTLYQLNQSINVTGNDCLPILNDSIILDCQGYNITVNGANESNYSAVFTLNFNNITVQNCIFVQNFTGVNQSSVSFMNSTNSTIFNNTMDSGISLDGSINANITANTINNSVGVAIILLSGSNSSIIENNNITTISTMGISVEESPNINISSNNITSTYTGGIDGGMIRLEDSDESIVDHNIITTSGEGASGIIIEDVFDALVNLNTITTSGDEAFGIFLDGITGINITSNNITTSGDHGDGINLQGSDDSVITQNIIQTGHSDACVITIGTSGYNNSLYDNIFNTSSTHSGACLDDALANTWNITFNDAITNIIGRSAIGGNFWTNNASTGYSDTCLDEDGDYICDDQYTLTGTNIDYLPLANHTNKISGCGTLDVANETYTLNQSISVNGTCFNITANNITLNLQGKSITGNGAGYGINVTGYNDTTIVGGTVYNFSNGVYIDASSNNAFTNLIINNSAQDAILLAGATSGNNNFTNVSVTNTNSSYYDINFSTAGINGTWIIDIQFTNYTFTGAGGLVNFKEPSFGEIKFLEAINGNGTSLHTDVDIDDNWVFVNGSKSGLNKSANISFYDVSFTDPKPQYRLNSSASWVNCTSSTNPACVEFSYTKGGTFTFNVSHFTYFKIIEGYTAPTEDEDTPSGGAGTVEVKETHSWTEIIPGVAAIMKDFDKEIGIKQIQIEVHTEAQDVKVIVTKYDGKPAEVSVEKSGEVYKYLQIETENLEDKLDKATLTIQVNKSWVSDNGLEEDDIALFKFNESEEEWEELGTIHTESDNDYYYYDVELESFSYFAIGEKVIEEEEEVGLVEKLKENLIWLWIIIGVVVLAAIIGIAIKKRKR